MMSENDEGETEGESESVDEKACERNDHFREIEDEVLVERRSVGGVLFVLREVENNSRRKVKRKVVLVDEAE